MTTLIIHLDAYLHHGSKHLMAKVYEGGTMIHAQTAPSEQLRKIIAEDFPGAIVVEPTNQAEVDAEWERDWSPEALARADKNWENRQNASRPFRR